MFNNSMEIVSLVMLSVANLVRVWNCIKTAIMLQGYLQAVLFLSYLFHFPNPPTFLKFFKLSENIIFLFMHLEVIFLRLYPIFFSWIGNYFLMAQPPCFPSILLLTHVSSSIASAILMQSFFFSLKQKREMLR